MTKKDKHRTKFNPEITKTKLAPEQAVMFCDCYDTGYLAVMGNYGYATRCRYYGKVHEPSPGYWQYNLAQS